MGDITPYIPPDMTTEELSSLEDYKENGLPGLAKMQESDAIQWFNLYMSGKTYNEISEMTGGKRDLILYIAYKSRWAEKRIKHYEDMIQNIASKTSRAKLEGANTVSSIITALNRYYANKFNRFLKTNDNSIIENLDPKILTQYYKSIETLDKLMSAAKAPMIPAEGTTNPNDKPNININVGPNAEVRQNEDGGLEITDNTAKQLLLELSKMKKEAESDKK